MKAFVYRFAAVAAVFALVASSGCGGRTGDVSGVVKLKGQPLDGGQVIFKGGSGKLIGADINADGTFTALGIPTGKVQVGVSYVDPKATEYFRALSAASKEGKAQPKGKPEDFNKVPGKYGDPEGSGLTIEVKAGKNEGVEIDLKPGD